MFESVNNVKLTLALIFCISCVTKNDGARILGVFSSPYLSHQAVFRALTEELARRKHDLVVITPSPVHYTEPEYESLKQIDISNVTRNTSELNQVHRRMQNMLSIDAFALALTRIQDLLESQLSHPEIQNLIHNSEEHFDLCIIEFVYPTMYAFKDKFNCPLIIISSLTGFLQNFDSFGVPTHPLLYSDLFASYTNDNLNIWKKFVLIYESVYYRYLYYWKFLPVYNNLARKYFGSSVRPVDEIENNADLLFLNYHPILFGIRPLVPAVINLGSLHIKPPKPLPSNLQRLLDDSTEGVIYFSFGSNIQSIHLPSDTRKIFFEAFKKLPYKILWKWENDTLQDQPENVIISKWLPQQDILGHPNIKVFITQGGQQSLEEAIHHKVPLIGIPFVADQDHNVNRMVALGIGKGLQINTITEDQIRNTIIEVIENPSYRSNIAKLRDILYDQPQSSLERAVWWTEYVLRHGGARFLRSPAADTSFWSYFMLDLLASLLAALTATILTIYTIYRFFKYITSSTKLKTS